MTAPAPPDDFHVLHLDTGREWRGGQAQVFTLARGLQEAGVAQTLLAPPGSPLLRRCGEAKLPCRAFPHRSEWNPAAVAALRRLCRESDTRVLHAHDAHAHALARRAVRGTVARAVVSRRVDFAIKSGPLSRLKYLDPALRYFAISRGVRQVLIEGGVAEERIRLVPSGTDPARLEADGDPAALRRELDIPADAPLIGSVGSLVDHKDHLTWLDAAQAIHEARPEARFLIAGEGPLRPALERRIDQLGLTGRVALPGYRRDMGACLRAMDLFLLSSKLEGLCTSLIDAMFLGRPAVGTDTGGVPDLIEHEVTGLLAPPGDGPALARAALELLADPARAARLALAARKRVETRHSARALVENTLEGYRWALATDISPG